MNKLSYGGNLDPRVVAILADPITKQPVPPTAFPLVGGVLDARIFLKNTHGFIPWAKGQENYEASEGSDELSSDVKPYLAEIEYDRPVYEHFALNGAVVDIGGGVGTVREFLPDSAWHVSIDPYINAEQEMCTAKKEAYRCLSKPLNFIAATAEFLPFVAESFDWAHMRSVLDHVQVPDLALREALRVLKSDGRVLVGLYVEGGKSGRIGAKRRAKDAIKKGLNLFGIDRWKDYHVWHPTFQGLLRLVESNGFAVEDVYWQPHWRDQVCYVCAKKAPC